MAQNAYFNNYFNSNEQDLVNNLIIEAIEMHGIDSQYLKRTAVDVDGIFGEPQYEQFNDAATVTVYVKNTTSFEGDGQFLQKFGLEIRDQITLTVALRSFNTDVGTPLSLTRPREGDAFYVPILNAIYQIKFVETASVYFQFGDMQVYDLVCELLEFNNQVFATGNTTVDSLLTYADNLADQYFLVDESNNHIITSTGHNLISDTYNPKDFNPFAENEEIQKGSDAIIDWTDIDPFSEKGKF